MWTPRGSQRASFNSEAVPSTETRRNPGRAPQSGEGRTAPGGSAAAPATSDEKGGHAQARGPPLPKKVRRRRRFRSATRPDGPGRAACSMLSRDMVRSDYCSSRGGVGRGASTWIQSGATAQPTPRDRQRAPRGNPGPRQAPVSMRIGSMRPDYPDKLHVTRLPWEHRIALAMTRGPRPVGSPAEWNSLDPATGSSPGPSIRQSSHHTRCGVATARRLRLLDGLRGSSHSE